MPDESDTPPSKAKKPRTSPDCLQSEMSATDVRLEREKLVLERERLALERERMESEREQWRTERELLGQASSGLQVSVGIFGLAVAAALLIAGLIGFNSGLEAGRHQAPLPRHVVVSQQFLDLLARTPRVSAPELSPSRRMAGESENFDWFALYQRPQQDRAAGNLLLLR